MIRCQTRRAPLCDALGSLPALALAALMATLVPAHADSADPSDAAADPATVGDDENAPSPGEEDAPPARRIVLPGTSSSGSENPIETFRDGALQLDVHLPTGYVPRYGFVPVLVTATNPTQGNAHWAITLLQNTRGQAINPGGHRETVTAGPGQTIERQILVATGEATNQPGWQNIVIRVVTPSGDARSRNLSWSRGSSDISTPILSGPAAATVIEFAPDTRGDSLHSRLDIHAAPGDWRGYTRFEVIALTRAEWQDLPPVARSALGDWTRFGGHLQFIDLMPPDAPETDNPNSFARGLGGVHRPPEPESQKYAVRELPAVKTASKARSPASAATFASAATMRAWLEGERWELVRDRFRTWPMLLVLLVFVVMVAPVNLFVLAPSKRRHRLFLTTPIISLAACSILVVAVLLGDGIGGNGERAIWIESRPGDENRHFITQWQASRSGALLSNRFTVEDAAYIAPMMAPGGTTHLEVGAHRVQGSGGWFTSRAAQAHFLQATRPGRGRLEWSQRDPDSPSVVSTFDFPLRDVYFTLDGETWWHAPEMLQGSAATFTRIDATAATRALTRQLVSFPHRNTIRDQAARAGHFIAFTDTPPAIDTLRSIRWQDAGVVTGLIATP